MAKDAQKKTFDTESSIERCIQYVETKVCPTSVTKQARAELAQLSQAVEAAQGAMIEAAARLAEKWGSDDAADEIRALQTEPMAAALAARDKRTCVKAEIDTLEYLVETAQSTGSITLATLKGVLLTLRKREVTVAAAARKETP